MYLERLWCSAAWAPAATAPGAVLEACVRLPLRAIGARRAGMRSVVGVPARFIGGGGAGWRGTARLRGVRRALFEDLHEDFRASFRTFLEREVVGEDGRYGEWEREGIIPREVFARAGSGGFLAMGAPERFGGAGAEDFRL